jgi:hypothetical protein
MSETSECGKTKELAVTSHWLHRFFQSCTIYAFLLFLFIHYSPFYCPWSFSSSLMVVALSDQNQTPYDYLLFFLDVCGGFYIHWVRPNVNPSCVFSPFSGETEPNMTFSTTVLDHPAIAFVGARYIFCVPH